MESSLAAFLGRWSATAAGNALSSARSAMGGMPRAEMYKRRWQWRCGAEGGTSAAALRRRAPTEASGTGEGRAADVLREATRSGWWRAGTGGGVRSESGGMGSGRGSAMA